MYYLNILFLVVLNVSKAFFVVGRLLASEEPGHWFTCNMPEDRLITMDNNCDVLLLCFQSNGLTNSGISKLGSRFRATKLSTNENRLFAECAKVMKGNGWHGLIISKGKYGQFKHTSNFGFNGMFSTEQIIKMEKETKINVTQSFELLNRAFQETLLFGAFLEDYGLNKFLLLLLPSRGQSAAVGGTRLCKAKCTEINSRKTTASFQSMSFHGSTSLAAQTIITSTQTTISMPIVKLLKFSDIDCGRVLANDRAYIEQRTKSSPVTVTGADNLPTDCGAIRARYTHFEYQNIRQKGVAADNYPLAFIRAVYQDYLFIEMEFATSYVAQNWYCYAIDKNSPKAFHDRIHSLAKCFPNVLVTSTENEFDMDGFGHNYSKSCMECMKLLAEKPWHYVILLQNDDVQLKTNDELVQIFKWMNGANDIQYTHIGSEAVDFAKNNWHLDHLKLFKNAIKNRADLNLQKNKGNCQMSLTRAFVHWLLNELDVSILLDQLNSYRYGVDEYFIQTLAANEFLGAPGGFTQKCFDKELSPGLTRMTIWSYGFAELCNSGIFRHAICIFGLRDLVPHLNGSNNPFMFANKMQLSADAEAVQCWHEQMFNRTFLYPTLDRLNKSVYSELPQVRYNTEKQLSVDGTFDSDTFNCRYKFIDMVKQYQQLGDKYSNIAKRALSAITFEADA